MPHDPHEGPANGAARSRRGARGAGETTSASRAPTSLARGSAPDGWITRGDAAKLLGVAKASVRRLEKSGELSALLDASGHHRFDPVRVGELARARAAPRASSAVTPTPVAKGTTQTASALANATSAATKAPMVAPDVDARVFELIGRGIQLREIVTELELPAEVVAGSARKWHELALLEGEVDNTLSTRDRIDLLECWRGDVEPLLGSLTARVLRLEGTLGRMIQHETFAGLFRPRP